MTEPLPSRVLALLADRTFHSGSELARACAVSRGAIWKAVSALRELGVQVEAVSNRGYRLPRASVPLQADRIEGHLAPAVRSRLRHGQTLWTTDSTNAQLLQRAAPPPGRFDFLTAEYQSAGRGRRSRRWWAPPGGAICLSLAWSFAALPADIAALSLAVGVCVLRALDLPPASLALKWPNDLVSGAAKLGGILTELRAEAAGPALVVIGIGLNVELGPDISAQVQASGTQPIDLQALGVEPRDRSVLTAALIGHCIAGLEQFEKEGFRPFMAEWCAADALAGKEVLVSAEGEPIVGHARGIDTGGALCVQTREGLQRFVSGEVSVRPAA